MSRKNEALNSFANASFVLMNPVDVRKLGLSEGDTVRLSNDRGDLTTILRVSGEVAPGELFMPWHFSESPVNNLTRGELDPMSRIAPFKLSACAVELPPGACRMTTLAGRATSVKPQERG